MKIKFKVEKLPRCLHCESFEALRRKNIEVVFKNTFVEDVIQGVIFNAWMA